MLKELGFFNLILETALPKGERKSNMDLSYHSGTPTVLGHHFRNGPIIMINKTAGVTVKMTPKNT